MRPWRVELSRKQWGRARTRRTAQNLVDRPMTPGFARIVNERTGECWERCRGSWFRTEDVVDAPPAAGDPEFAWQRRADLQ